MPVVRDYPENFCIRYVGFPEVIKLRLSIGYDFLWQYINQVIAKVGNQNSKCFIPFNVTYTDFGWTYSVCVQRRIIIQEDRSTFSAYYLNPVLSCRFGKRSFRHLYFCWWRISSRVELLFFLGLYCCIRFRRLSDDVDGRSVIHHDDRYSWYDGLHVDVTKVATKDQRHYEFLYEENVEDLCACADLGKKFDSHNDGYCLFTRECNVRYIFPLNKIFLHTLRKIMEYYKTRAGSSLEDKHDDFPCWECFSNVSVHFVSNFRRNK